jgi:hypothetical protein
VPQLSTPLADLVVGGEHARVGQCLSSVGRGVHRNGSGPAAVLLLAALPTQILVADSERDREMAEIRSAQHNPASADPSSAAVGTLEPDELTETFGRSVLRQSAMGYSLSWLAVRGKAPEALLAQLGLTGTGTREDVQESEFVGAQLVNGWYVVVNDRDVRFIQDAVLAQVSAGCEAVTCFVEEHVMHSAATGWRNGEQMWAVQHDAQQGIDHLIEEGRPPAEVAAIRDTQRAKQASAGRDVDYIFDVPIELAYALTRFRHDQDLGAAAVHAEPFEILEDRQVVR